jgi:hypothetical protein
MTPASRPRPDEFASFYATYIDLVDDPVPRLEAQVAELERMLSGHDEATELRRYAPGKWSVREVMAHLVDVERVMAYRLLRVARGDATPLPGFDENAWIAGAGHDSRPVAAHLGEFAAARANTLALLRGLPAETLERRGTASGHPVSARALVWILAGHVDHHVRILADRYGIGA